MCHHAAHFYVDKKYLVKCPTGFLFVSWYVLTTAMKYFGGVTCIDLLVAHSRLCPPRPLKDPLGVFLHLDPQCVAWCSAHTGLCRLLEGREGGSEGGWLSFSEGTAAKSPKLHVQ